ncbi:unnamed protein product [Moneuplotes crassus]|uniref:Uncharacterized protein n=1 Tax=Euplotes crassus TaxID=5936 RepID=A0AAD1Y6V3_EUPCR|nr:unnamed protein product [Moneuplotes crassus]
MNKLNKDLVDQVNYKPSNLKISVTHHPADKTNSIYHPGRFSYQASPIKKSVMINEGSLQKMLTKIEEGHKNFASSPGKKYKNSSNESSILSSRDSPGRKMQKNKYQGLPSMSIRNRRIHRNNKLGVDLYKKKKVEVKIDKMITPYNPHYMMCENMEFNEYYLEALKDIKQFEKYNHKLSSYEKHMILNQASKKRWTHIMDLICSDKKTQTEIMRRISKKRPKLKRMKSRQNKSRVPPNPKAINVHKTSTNLHFVSLNKIKEEDKDESGAGGQTQKNAHFLLDPSSPMKRLKSTYRIQDMNDMIKRLSTNKAPDR